MRVSGCLGGRRCPIGRLSLLDSLGGFLLEESHLEMSVYVSALPFLQWGIRPGKVVTRCGVISKLGGIIRMLLMRYYLCTRILLQILWITLNLELLLRILFYLPLMRGVPLYVLTLRCSIPPVRAL